ncbi:MAG TPA: tetratricopeptide repeat protein [Blastocatellia bacterium]
MRSKLWLNLFAATLVFALAALSASAQVITVKGTVKLKQADGTTVPVQGALVKFYRTDINQTFESKTDKKGEYVNVGIPLVGTFTIAVSAPGARPDYMSNVKISQQPLNDFTLEPGDGTVLTLEQIKAARTAVASGAANPEEIKKRAAEAEKERTRIAEENKKIEELNTKLPDILKAGNAALDAKNYAEAINQYDQGIQLDPEQAIFYAQKASAMRQRGVERYNGADKAKDKDQKAAEREAARADFKGAVEATEKAVEVYRKRISQQPAGTPAPANDEVGYLAVRAESYRLALQTSTPVDPSVAVTAIEEYITKETDPVKRDKAQASLGNALFTAGRIDEAVAKYRDILAKNPGNLDAEYGLGIALAAQVQDPVKDAALLAQARDTLQAFVDKAPDTNLHKAEAIESIKYLDDTIKTAKTPAPEVKGTTTPKRKRP